ncbi:MAG: hypothetical protein HOP29_15420 [Phycisphaerales bacterium]|nr:hypothetical protein [Phycisphaerales bacterium]
MTIRLNLTPEVEARLKAQAAATGMSLDSYLHSLIEQAARSNASAATTVALLDAWEREDETDDPAELERRRADYRCFATAMNANRQGQRALFP